MVSAWGSRSCRPRMRGAYFGHAVCPAPVEFGAYSDAPASVGDIPNGVIHAAPAPCAGCLSRGHGIFSACYGFGREWKGGLSLSMFNAILPSEATVTMN
eukprot:6133265-Pyramimonas_sp.AAC.1